MKRSLPASERHRMPIARPAPAPGSAARAISDAWTGRSGDGAAALALAGGDVLAAAALGGEGMRALAAGRLDEAAAWASARPGSAAKLLVAAEVLMAGGRIAAGLARLERLARRSDPAGTLAFARHCDLLGDHGRAETVAAGLPHHPGAALIGARAALLAHRPLHALARLHPFLSGEEDTPDPSQAGAIGVAGAAALARMGHEEELGTFARRALSAGMVPAETLPALARIGWTGGLGAQAWARMEDEGGAWAEAAKAELALLAGDAARAARHAEIAGGLGAPARPALDLLTGAAPEPAEDEGLTRLAESGETVHVWRTHATRWMPWIESLRARGVSVRICDLARGLLPDPKEVPARALDDGSLVRMVEPTPAPRLRPEGIGTWVDSILCEGVGIGHDLPEDEHRAILRTTSQAATRDGSRVRVVGAEAALDHAAEGHPEIVLAPPGDPFWAGPLPERAWPAMRIVRADPVHGWTGVGERIGAIAREFGAPGGR